MEIKEIKFSNGIDVKKKATILNEGLKMLSSLTDLKIKMEDLKSREDASFSESMDLIIDYEEILALDYDVLDNCHKKSIGTSGAIRRRINAFCALFETLRESLKPNVEAFAPLEEEDYNLVYSLLSESIGQLACYLSFQFGFSKFTEGSEITEVTDAVDYWIRENKKTEESIIDLGMYLTTLVRTCNPHMGVFEKYPELLEPFSNLVDEVIYDCADVDIKTIYAVLEGKIEVQDFIESIEKKESGA